MSDTLVTKLQHFAVEVSDMDRSIEFYRKFLDMKLTERHAAYECKEIPLELAFLRVGRVHHDLVLAHNSAKKYRPKSGLPQEESEGQPSFHHFAFECPDRESWLKLLKRARDMGLNIVRGPVVHSPWDPRGDGSWGENESFYVMDPDNHRIEIFCDMATIDPDGTFVNHSGDRIEQAKVAEN
jgi:catechol 2,3-dioxygenase